MKKLIFFFVISIFSCNKETNIHKIFSASEIEKLNNYQPDFTQFEKKISDFQKQRKAYKNLFSNENNNCLKSYILINDIPLEDALFIMEVILNYEFANIGDSTMVYDHTDTMSFAVIVEDLGDLVLNGNNFMEQFVIIENFLTDSLSEEDLFYCDINLTNIENGMAYFTCEKVEGTHVSAIIGEDEFGSEQSSVLAIDPYLCDLQTQSEPGYVLINEKLFAEDNSSLACSNGGNIVFWGFSNPNVCFISGNSFINDPVLGYGTAGTLGYVFEAVGIGYEPDQCLDYNQLNQYLNGARAIYSRWRQVLNSDMVILYWRLERYDEHIAIDDSYYVGMPILYQTVHFYCTTMPE